VVPPQECLTRPIEREGGAKAVHFLPKSGRQNREAVHGFMPDNAFLLVLDPCLKCRTQCTVKQSLALVTPAEAAQSSIRTQNASERGRCHKRVLFASSAFEVASHT